jgi:hypothetical protein
MYRETSKPQALPSKRNGLSRGQGPTPLGILIAGPTVVKA